MEEILSRRALDYFCASLMPRSRITHILRGCRGHVRGGRGRAEDVYVLGAKEPLLTFEGKVIAVWHRFDDSEDKWIVSLNGEAFREEVILGIFHFRSNFLGEDVSVVKSIHEWKWRNEE